VERQHLAKEDRDNVVAMTTPVFMSGSDSNRTMAFVMPARHGVNSIDNPCQGGHGSVDGVQTSSRVYPT